MLSRSTFGPRGRPFPRTAPARARARLGARRVAMASSSFRARELEQLRLELRAQLRVFDDGAEDAVVGTPPRASRRGASRASRADVVGPGRLSSAPRFASAAAAFGLGAAVAPIPERAATATRRARASSGRGDDDDDAPRGSFAFGRGFSSSRPATASKTRPPPSPSQRALEETYGALGRLANSNRVLADRLASPSVDARARTPGSRARTPGSRSRAPRRLDASSTRPVTRGALYDLNGRRVADDGETLRRDDPSSTPERRPGGALARTTRRTPASRGRKPDEASAGAVARRRARVGVRAPGDGDGGVRSQRPPRRRAAGDGGLLPIHRSEAEDGAFGGVAIDDQGVVETEIEIARDGRPAGV